ncbi:LOW QUALITY PROTEIN: vomeronasal type-1 receptor 4-like [Antechinus flavipes]|uniref:LOW QUALITY PROTEIN: vomeronasal type-1 receptor 4-like n=1 Tax=Antechinus flavipes TaxID=38775 RepID=UPI0022365BDE|nr:LOW QUALITY PROTEIN: vomeronasal type-1 receptor 4-like [Antechinus flavipes]
MQSNDNIFCILHTFQIIIGVFGNGLLLFLYGFNLVTGQRTRPIDMIFVNLFFSHIVMILFRGIPLAIQVCTQEIFLSDTECKIIVYLQRVSRGLSLCNTCLLSVFQAITISSNNNKWAKLKANVPKHIVLSCVFMWVLNLLVDVVVPRHVTGPRNHTFSDLKKNLGYCSIDWHAVKNSNLVMWKTLYDVVFLGFMAISSGYMVLVLFRHKWQVQHLHSTSVNPIATPETRATKVILLLMITFVCFYSVSSIFVIVTEKSNDTSQWIIHMTVFFTSFYSTVSPFVLISSDSQILNCCNLFKRIKILILIH